MKKSYKIIYVVIFIFAVIMLISPLSYAGRPLETEDAATVGNGVFQIEAGREWTYQRDGDKETCQSFVFTYGFADNFDFVIEKPCSFFTDHHHETEFGVHDSVLSIKYRFIDEKDGRPAIGIKAFTDLEDGGENGTSGNTEFGGRLFITKSLGEAKIHFNIGYIISDIGNGLSRDDVILYGLAAEQPLSSRWCVVGEFFGAKERKSARELAAKIGLTYSASPTLVFDAAYTRGLTENTPKSGVIFGVTAKF